MAKFVCDYIHSGYHNCEGYVMGEKSPHYTCDCKHLNLIYCSSESMIDIMTARCAKNREAVTAYYANLFGGQTNENSTI